MLHFRVNLPPMPQHGLLVGRLLDSVKYTVYNTNIANIFLYTFVTIRLFYHCICIVL